MDARFWPNGLVREDGYAATMQEVVWPFLTDRRRDETVPGRDGKPLFTSRYDAAQPLGTVVVVHGFTECGDKFAELVYSLLQNHFSVLTLDQRGHGRSWRSEGLAEGSLTHVERFDDYVADLRLVVEHHLPNMPRPAYLLAHSMGGAVSALYLETYPAPFERAVLCSPMIAPNRGGIPMHTSRIICRVAKINRHNKRRIFVSRPYAGSEDFATSCATSKARFDWFDVLKQNTPEWQNNGPTYGWTYESLLVTRTLLRRGAPEGITCPVMLWAAEDDNSVLPEPQKTWIARVPQGRLQQVAGTRHEIYRSTDEVLLPWWNATLAFLRDGVWPEGTA